MQKLNLANKSPILTKKTWPTTHMPGPLGSLGKTKTNKNITVIANIGWQCSRRLPNEKHPEKNYLSSGGNTTDPILHDESSQSENLKCICLFLTDFPIPLP